MRVLTVQQPWAWAIIHGGKTVENRTRSLGPYRGPVAIHVAKSWGWPTDLDVALREAQAAWLAAHPDAPKPSRVRGTDRNTLGYLDPYPWQIGNNSIIGVVDLVDVHHGPEFGGGCHKLGSPLPVRADYGLCSPWGEAGAYHLVLAAPRPLTRPIPFRGSLGLRRLDDVTVARVLAEVAS